MFLSSSNVREVTWGLEGEKKTLEKETGVLEHRLRFNTGGLGKYSSSLTFFHFFLPFLFHSLLEPYFLLQEWPIVIGVAKIRICQRYSHDPPALKTLGELLNMQLDSSTSVQNTKPEWVEIGPIYRHFEQRPPRDSVHIKV